MKLLDPFKKLFGDMSDFNDHKRAVLRCISIQVFETMTLELLLDVILGAVLVIKVSNLIYFEE